MADRIVSVRFVVDSREGESATKRLTEGLQRLDANFKAAANGQGKLTGTMGQAFRAQLAYERKIDSTAKFVQQYWKAEQDLMRAKRAGLEVTEEQIRGLQNLQREMVKQIALNSRVGATGAFGPSGNMDKARQQIAATRAEMNKLMSTQNSVLGMLNNVSFKLFVITFAIRQAAEMLLRVFVQTGEEVEKLRTRIEMLGGDASTFDSLYQSAQKLGVGLAEYAGTFTRFAIAREQIGATNEELLQMTETLAQLGILGGGTAQEIGAGMQQLAQGFASGRLQGDELRSVLENMPLVAVKLAEALGKPVGALREMGSQGELTGQVMLEAFEKIAPEVQRMFENLPLTTDRALAAMRNSWSLLINELLRATGTDGLANAFMDVSKALEAMAKYVRENAELFARLIDVAAKTAAVMAGAFVATQIVKWTEALRLAYVQLALTAAAARAAGQSMFTFNGGITAMLGMLNPLVAVLSVAAGLVWSFSSSANAATESSQALTIELENLEAGFEGVTVAQARALEVKALDKLDQIADEISDAANRLGIAQQRLETTPDMKSDAYEKWRREVIKVEAELEKLKKEQTDTNTVVDRAQALIKDLGDQARGAADGIDDVTDAAIQSADELKKLTDTVEDLKLEYLAMKTAGSGAVDAFKANRDIMEAVNAGDMDTAEALRDQYVHKLLIDNLKKEEQQREKTTRATQASTAAVKEETKAYEGLIKQYLPLKSVAEEYEKVQRDVNAAMAEGNLTAAEGAQILARAREEMYERARKAEEQFTEAAKTESTEWQKLWETTVERVDDAFAQMWEDLLSGTKSTMETLKNLIIKTVAEIAHRLITQPLVLNIAAGIGVGGGAGSAMAGQGGILGGGGGFGLGNITSLFTGNSIGTTLGSNLTWLTSGGQGALYAPGWAQSAASGLMGTPNWALGGGALLGGLAGNMLFGDKGYGSIGSGIGSTAGSLIAGAMAAGPVGVLLAGLLGGVGGGFVGSLFGDKTDPRAQWIATPGTRGFEDNVFARSDTLGLSFGLGGKSHGVEAEEYRQTLQGFAMIADTIGTFVGEEVAAQIREKVAGVTDQMKGPGLAVDGWSAEAAFQQIFTEILDFGAETGDLMAVLLEERVGTLSGTMEEMAEQIMTAVAELQLLPEAVKGFETLGLHLGDTEEASYRAALAIADLAGGIDKLMIAQEYYYQNFFTETERLQKQYDDARGVIVAFNKELGRSEESYIDTRAELREYVESLDLTTEAGREAYWAAMELAPAIITAADAMDQLGGAATGVAFDIEAAIATMVAAQQKVSEMLSSTAEDVKLRMMTDEQKYNYFTDEIDRLVAVLPTLTSVESIVQTVEQINDLSQKAIALLSDEQLMAGMGEGWIKFLEEIGGMATGLIEKITIEQAEAAGEMEAAAQIIAGSGERIAAAASVFDNSARVIAAAAAAIPREIKVNVVVTERSSEVA